MEIITLLSRVAGVTCAYAAIALTIGAMNFPGAAYWWRFGPLTLAIAGAGIALLPGNRWPAIASCVIAIAVGISASRITKLYFPLCFAAYASLLIAATAVFWPRVAATTLVLIAFVEAAWIASLARQSLYELATVGHLTDLQDSCNAALFSIWMPMLLLLALSVAAVASRAPSLAGIVSGRAAAYLAGGARRLPVPVALLLGTVFGIVTWHDWQPNSPCL